MSYCPRCASPLQPRHIDGVERHVCAAGDCGFVHWDNPVPVVAAVVEYRDHLLLAHNAAWPPGVFSLITGYLERHEDPARAVVREVEEELGLAAEVRRFIGHYPFVPKNQLLIAYAVVAHGELRTGEEIDATRMIPRDAVPGHDFGRLAVTRQIVADWLADGGQRA